MNHGLRPAADEEERFCRALGERLGVRLHVERVQVSRTGNLEAAAREARYAAAEAVRLREGLDIVATGHTASDQAETVLYRLVSSPGRRALIGMAPRRDRIVRPLLQVTGADTRAYCLAAGLPWREDESNEDRSLARNRLRLDVIPALREIHPAAESNILATAAQLRDEAGDRRARGGGGARACRGGRQPRRPWRPDAWRRSPGVRRLMLQRLAERAAGGPVAARGRSAARGRWSAWPRAGGAEWSTSAAGCGRWPSTAWCGSCAARRTAAAGGGCPGGPRKLPLRSVGGRSSA